MDITSGLTGIVIVAIVFGAIFIAPVLLFRPLIVAIANRIAGKSANADEVKTLRAKVVELEQQVHSMSTRMLAMEDAHEFSKKLLEDMSEKANK